ncbi:MAG TPA: hypothetical protein VGX95_09435 [Xanthobacteraceae bacterium]|jgi:hypothetical protein|nr:hypothetical protein [Xanthobacteraceae bacterium]
MRARAAAPPRPAPAASRRGRFAGLQRACGNQAVLRLIDNAAPSSRAAPAGANEMERAQGAPTPAPAAAPAPVPTLTLAAAQAVMDRADDLRIDYLTETRKRVRQVQIACQEQADAKTITDIFPEEIRAFLSAFGIGPWTPNFCLEVALIHSDIEKNF